MSRYHILIFCGVFLEFTFGQNRRPFGPLMCLRLCHQTSGCSQIAFVASDLTCYVTNVKEIISRHDSGLSTQKIQIKVKRNQHAGISMVCPHNLRIILTRTKRKKCVKVLKERRVTMLMYSIHEKWIYQLDISNNSSQKLFRMKSVILNTMVYDKSSRRLIYTAHMPRRIESSTIDGQELLILKTYMIANSLALDEGRQLLFFISDRGYIYRMNLNGYNFIKLLRHSGKHIRLDPDNRNFYVHDSSLVHRGKYNGSQLKQIYSGQNITDIAFDYVKLVLYALDGQNIMQVNLIKKTNTLVISFKFSPDLLFYQGESLYYISKSGTHTEIGVLKDGGYQVMSNFEIWSFAIFVV